MGWGINIYDLLRVPIRKVCNGYYLRWYYNGWHYWYFLPGTLTVVTEGEKYRTYGHRKVLMGSGQVTRGQMLGIRTIMMTREVSLLTLAGWMNIRIEPGSMNVYNNTVAGAEVEFIAMIGSKEVSYNNGYTPVPDIPVVPPAIIYCSINIGSQTWMCKNWDSNYPGSKVLSDNEGWRNDLGGLYTYNQIMSPGFVPTGWHVPFLSEVDTLIAYLGTTLTAGGRLKGTTHWYPPNTGLLDSGFLAKGGGYWDATYGYMSAFYIGAFWMADCTTNDARIFMLSNASATIDRSIYFPKNWAASLRLIKDSYVPAIYNDWFLPSRDELIAMYDELYVFGVGGFDPNYYWSSTEYDANNAYGSVFTIGVHNAAGKSNSPSVRACRFFTSLTVYALRGVGPAGGLIFWKSGNDYLEAAPTDQADTQIWSNIDTVEIGVTAQGQAIGTGQANTTAIIGQALHTNSAAKLCDDLVT
jgi:uncharacterized protein (TIGR02145 family)